MLEESELPLRYPIRGIFFGCCASAKEALDSRVAAKRQIIIFMFIVSASRLSNHPIRPCQHIRRNRQADLLGGFQIDDELELLRLLHPEIGGASRLLKLFPPKQRGPDPTRCFF